MNRILLFLFVASALAAGCAGNGSDPTEPPPPARQDLPEIVSGTFDVTSAATIDGCDVPTEWSGTYDVHIDSTAFSMGIWKGSWDAGTLRAVGESVRDKTQARYCTVTRWTTVYITFSSEDKFSGSVVYRLRLAGDCNDRSTCTSSWTINGIRRPPAP